jgi:hypothetical protein
LMGVETGTFILLQALGRRTGVEGRRYHYILILLHLQLRVSGFHQKRGVMVCALHWAFTHLTNLCAI